MERTFDLTVSSAVRWAIKMNTLKSDCLTQRKLKDQKNKKQLNWLEI